MKKLKLKANRYPGKLIVFEGVDGSGKTTLADKAVDFLGNRGIACKYVKMPSDRVRNLSIFNDYDNSTDSETRNTVDLINITVFVSGDRLLTLDTEIIPALKEGKYVLCDRYCFTGFVRCDDDIIYRISKRFIRPDCTFLATASPLTVEKRVKGREKEKNNHYDRENVLSQMKRFDFLAKKQGFIKLDTDMPEEKTDNQLYSALEEIISKSQTKK